MADLSKATARPWLVHDFTNAISPSYVPSPGDVTVSCDHPASITVAYMGGSITGSLDEARANAALIVRAVNERDELIAALRELLNADGRWQDYIDQAHLDRAHSMLAKVESI